MWLSFTRPEYLLLLPAALWLLWRLARGSYADLRGRRRALAWAVRVVIITALVFALAGAQFVKRSKGNTTVFALDASYSISQPERARALAFIQEALKHKRPNERAAMVVFGREAVVESENLRPQEKVQVTSTPAPTHSDIASALRLSLGLITPGTAGRVVLLSDGNENVGSAVQETLLAQASKVPVDVVPLQARSARDVLVKEVSAPADARRGEPFPLRVTLQSTEPAQGRLTVLADGNPILRRNVTIAAGTTSLRLPVMLEQPGLAKLEVLVESGEDASQENNRGIAFSRVRGKPRVLVVAGDRSDASELSPSLQAQDVVVTAGGGELVPTSPADLDRYDSIVLASFPAYGMTDRQMTMLRDGVRDLGVGLGMIGGEFSFGAGGYYRSPIEEALPVTMDLKKHRVFPASAIILVIDTSGSMAMPEDGVEKVQLAAEAACAVVDLLQPQDSVGVVASDPRPTMICDLRQVGNKSSVKSDIRSLRAMGGGIAVFPSMGAAYNVLKNYKAPVRHMIVLADGSDCDEQAGSVPLAALMASQKMTVTTIAFGDGPHVPFLKDVAAAGRGNFYLTARARDLKKILTRETLTIAKSVLVEERFTPRVAEMTEVTGGIDWGSTPPLLGYDATSPKSLAHVPLLTHKDDPLFAHWQYGLGRSIAFTSDAKAHWAAYWLGWSEFPRFWSQAVRWSLRQQDTGVLHPQVVQAGDKARVTIEATTEKGQYIDGLEIAAHVNQPGGERAEVPLTQVGPGKYEGLVPAPDSGSYVVGLHATGPGGFEANQTFGFAVPYPPDLADTSTNTPFLQGLAEQTGGAVLDRPEAAFAPPAVIPHTAIDIWRALLWLAALLLPFDVAVRRLVIAQEDLEPFRQVVRSFLARLRPAAAPRPQTVTTGRLLDVKRSLQPRFQREETPAVQNAEAPAPSQAPPPAEPTPAAPPEPTPRAPAPAAARAASSSEERGSTTGRLLARKRERKGSL
jgi:uncharacterized membrane protein